MATKNFALKLDDQSIQTGDITFKELAEAKSPATFQLTHCGSGDDDVLRLITMKDGKETIQEFRITFLPTPTGEASLSASALSSVYGDAEGGDWDYVKAEWIVGSIDQGSASNMYLIQDGQTYDLAGWPPKTPS
ncbi:hypothetical protein KKC97_13140 [bacterium]|nr:hypothetical protein [bacterium]